jgi:tartrate dehydratase alpha subunit/fumarate hydratase class I-like protein
MTREIPVLALQEALETLLTEAVYRLPRIIWRRWSMHGTTRFGVRALHSDHVGDNARYAESEAIPTCQDTGMVIVHLA